jgi:phytoene/squalene synthetase
MSFLIVKNTIMKEIVDHQHMVKPYLVYCYRIAGTVGCCCVIVWLQGAGFSF